MKCSNSGQPGRNHPRWKLIVLLLLACVAAPLVRGAEPLRPEILAWLNTQTNLHTWEADFDQTRALKSLAQPLTATGHVWFAEPNRFRWELGKPAQTIAVRAPDEMLILYPRLKRVEKFPLGQQAGPWRDVMALLDAGFPRNAADIEGRYNIVSQSVQGPLGKLVLEPKSASARKLMQRITIEFDGARKTLVATELQLADGSSMRNDFKNQVLNPKVDEKLFNPEIPPDYKVSEPFKK